MININIDICCFELVEYFDNNFVNYLCLSLEFGFDIFVIYKSIYFYECKNILLVWKKLLVVDEFFYIEIERGNVKGLFFLLLFENYKVSFLGIVIYKYFGKKWLIFDLFFFYNNVEFSINEFVNKDLCILSYVRIDDVIEKFKIME